MTWRRALPAAELRTGELRGLILDGQPVLLVKTDFGLAAYPDRCLHKGVPLSRGRLEGCVLTCWAHEWQYDIRTGAGLNPDNVALASYPVEVRDAEIWVDVPTASPRRL